MWDRQLVPKFEQHTGQGREPGQARARDVSGATQSFCRLEHLLHAEGGPHLNLRMRHLRAGITKPMSSPGRNDHCVARAHQDPAAAQAKSHLARNHSEPLLLLRVHVPCRDVTPCRQKKIESEEPPTVAMAALANYDPLTADRVVEDPPSRRCTLSHPSMLGPLSGDVSRKAAAMNRRRVSSGSQLTRFLGLVQRRLTKAIENHPVGVCAYLPWALRGTEAGDPSLNPTSFQRLRAG